MFTVVVLLVPLYRILLLHPFLRTRSPVRPVPPYSGVRYAFVGGGRGGGRSRLHSSNKRQVRPFEVAFKARLSWRHKAYMDRTLFMANTQR